MNETRADGFYRVKENGSYTWTVAQWSGLAGVWIEVMGWHDGYYVDKDFALVGERIEFPPLEAVK